MAPIALFDDRSSSNGDHAAPPTSILHDKDLLEPVAVVGFSLKFPQDALSAKSFWNMLLEGRCAKSDVPKDRFDVDSFYVPGTKRQDEASISIRT